MPLPPRDMAPGIHHVTVGATGFELYFTDDSDRLTWLRRLIQTLERYDWTCILFCQMTTHIHLIVDIPDMSLPTGMHFLNLGYSKAYNGEHGRRGRFIRARYWSKRVRTNAQLLTTYRYAARDPVRAGLCDRAEVWPWSSVATTCALANSFPFVDAARVIDQFGRRPTAAKTLLAYLAAGD